MEEEQMPASKAQAAVAPIAAAPVNSHVKLPTFWPANIDAWFTSVERVFQLRGITNVLAALTDTTVVLISNLMETWP
jgi:hypothetical protein